MPTYPWAFLTEVNFYASVAYSIGGRGLLLSGHPHDRLAVRQHLFCVTQYIFT